MSNSEIQDPPNRSENSEIPNAESHHTITKRIRSTNYIVNIFNSTTSKESFNDKLLRLIKNDIANGAK